MRIRIAVAAAALACLTLAGCASAATSKGSPAPGQKPAPSRATTASNRAATRAEAQRLLGLVSLPRSATPTTARPEQLDRPPMGTPGSSSLIDVAKYWRVPMSLHRAGAWIGAHPPRGVAADGSGSSSTRGPDGLIAIGYDYADERSDPAWTQAQLEIGVAPEGPHASIWRVDGLALWLDTRPQHAPPAERPLRIAATGRCPASDRGANGVPPGSATSLLPDGAPDAALICAYTGLNGRAFTLGAHRRLDAAQAARLARLAVRIDLAHTGGAPISCPADFGTATVLAFGYPGGRNAELWLTDSGCRSISNGTIAAGIAGGTAGFETFLRAVSRLLAR